MSKKDVSITDLEKQILLNRVGYGRVFELVFALCTNPHSRIILGDYIIDKLLIAALQNGKD